MKEKRKRGNKRTAEGDQSQRIKKEDVRDREIKKDKERGKETERKNTRSMISMIEMTMIKGRRDDCLKLQTILIILISLSFILRNYTFDIIDLHSFNRK